MFRKDPWQYAPAFGGFCAWGLAKETGPYWPWSSHHLGPPATPWEGWALIPDNTTTTTTTNSSTLIFNIWASYTDRFLEEVDLNMEAAIRRWKKFHKGKLHTGPFNTHCIGRGPLENFCISPQPHPWTYDLPDCESSSGGGGGGGGGGGIVSPHKFYADFRNDNMSPFGKRLAVIGGTVFGVLFVMVSLIQWYRIGGGRTCCHQKGWCVVTKQPRPKPNDDTTPEESSATNEEDLEENTNDAPPKR